MVDQLIGLSKVFITGVTSITQLSSMQNIISLLNAAENLCLPCAFTVQRSEVGWDLVWFWSTLLIEYLCFSKNLLISLNENLFPLVGKATYFSWGKREWYQLQIRHFIQHFSPIPMIPYAFNATGMDTHHAQLCSRCLNHCEKSNFLREKSGNKNLNHSPHKTWRIKI